MKGEKRSGIHGIGINDADYQVTKSGRDDEGKVIRLWICPLYLTWKSMIDRCYSKNLHKRKPKYAKCSVVPEWHYFMTFRAWMENQDWEGKQLDKDLLSPENKIYGPDTCIFVSNLINSFILDSNSSSNELPIGVCSTKQKHKFKARCRNPFNGNDEFLGYFNNPEDAHKAWLHRKFEHATELSKNLDPRVSEALLQRYLPHI